MMLTHVEVTLTNLVTRAELTTDFTINREAKDSIVPTSELRTIGIEPQGKRAYQLANCFAEYEFGFAELTFLDERVFGQVLFGPEDVEPVLGTISLLAAGFVVDSENETLRKLPGRPLKQRRRIDLLP